MALRRKHLWIIGIIIAAVVLFTVRMVTTSSRYWSRRSIEASRDGTPLPYATSYRSNHGNFLIYLASEESWYSFCPGTSTMGVCSTPGFVPVYVGLIMRDEAAPCVHFGPTKASDPQLEVYGDHFIFTSGNNQRIQVWWAGP